MSPKPTVSYFKKILTNVYGYPSIFYKELKKAKNQLDAYDYGRLKQWASKLEKSRVTLD
jgi:hypothetical protein